jgi:hypothetical protein
MSGQLNMYNSLGDLVRSRTFSDIDYLQLDIGPDGCLYVGKWGNSSWATSKVYKLNAQTLEIMTWFPVGKVGFLKVGPITNNIYIAGYDWASGSPWINVYSNIGTLLWSKTEANIGPNVDIHNIAVGEVNSLDANNEAIAIAWGKDAAQGGIMVFNGTQWKWQMDHGKDFYGICWNTISSIYACGAENTPTEKIIARRYIYAMGDLDHISDYISTSPPYYYYAKFCIVDILGSDHIWAGGQFGKLTKWIDEYPIAEVDMGDVDVCLLERDNDNRLYCGLGDAGGYSRCTVLRRIDPNNGTTIWSKDVAEFGSIVAS